MNTSNRNQSWCYGNRSSRNNNRTIINPLFDIFGCWPFLKFINVFPELRPSGSIQFPQLPKLFNENPQLEEMSTDHCMYSVFHIMQLFPSLIKSNCCERKYTYIDVFLCLPWDSWVKSELYGNKFKFCKLFHALITCRQLWSLDWQAPQDLAGSSVPLIPWWQPQEGCRLTQLSAEVISIMFPLWHFCVTRIPAFQDANLGCHQHDLYLWLFAGDCTLGIFVKIYLADTILWKTL